jgi:hypothetical protein
VISFFPDPYPDELLYSVCARYKDRMCYPNSASAIQDFFGSSNASAVIDLPSRIDYLISILPPNHSYTADRIINNHTLAPFYIPFLPFKRAQLLRKDMKQTSGVTHTHERVGITTTNIKTPCWLRFCSLCARKDTNQFGEKYWHRVHQIPGVELCPTHAVLLENSPARWQSPNNLSRLVSANSVIPISQPSLSDASNSPQTHLLKIAQDVAWLLNWHGHSSDIRFLRKRYYNLLLKRGLAYFNGKIKTSSLSGELVSFFTQEFLTKMHSGVENYAKGWVYRLVHTNTLKITQHPVRHLLLITFLGYTAEEFFTTSYNFKPFGAKPWPCLNKASDHYREPMVSKCHITDSIEKKQHGKPMGIFRCAKCGFTYTRIGPDKSKKDRIRANSIQTYGPVWESILRESWRDTSLSTSEIGRKLGVSYLTVVRYAIRFGLSMNTPESRSVSEKTIQRYSKFRPSREEALALYRHEWLAVRKANPEASRNELLAIASFLYLWLRKNDNVWIESNLPPPQQKRSNLPRVDWKEVDRDLSEAVIRSATRIKCLEGKPVRASLAEIIRDIGHRTYLEQRLNKLPQTAKALHAHLESLEAFVIRKIEWTENCYRQEGFMPTRLQLMVRAVVRNKTGKTPTVQGAINATMERLSKHDRSH